MQHFPGGLGPRARKWLVLAAAVCLLAACSSGKKQLAPTSTSSTTSTTRTTTPSSTSTTTPSGSSTSAPISTQTTHTGAVTIAFFTGPPSPVDCLARQQSVQLHWRTTGAAGVTLRINGVVFASFPNGKQDPLEPLTCDGKAQTYELTARAPNGDTVSKSLTLSERGVVS